MDKIVELIGKIVEKLTSAKLLWTLILAILVFGAVFALIPTPVAPATKPFGLSCLAVGGSCVPADFVGILTLVAIALVVAAIIVWIAGRIKERYFV